jgi:hypothetical protein
MNLNLENDIPFVNQEDQEEEISQKQHADLNSIRNFFFFNFIALLVLLITIPFIENLRFFKIYK